MREWDRYMRRLLSVLMAIALVMLPLGGMPVSASAAAPGAAVPCHHAASGPAAAEMATHAGHDHGHAQHSAYAPEFGSTDASEIPVAGHSGKPLCLHCGVDCHCLTGCASACSGPAINSAILVPSLDVDGGIVAPGTVAVLRSWTTRPWPPPPRA